MRAFTVAMLTAAVTAAGCGSEQAAAPGGEAANAPGVMGCDGGGRASAALTEAERRASVVAGPLTLVYARQQAAHPAAKFDPTRQSLRDLINDPSSRGRNRRLARRTLANTRPGSYGVAAMRVRVSAGREATLGVPAQHRESVSLIYTARARNRENPGAAGAYRVDDGDPVITFRACDDADTEFLGGMVVAGARCVPLRITERARAPQHRLLSFGAGECVTSTDTRERDRLPAPARWILRRPPYMGVACPTANSIACDRIGLAVWLRQPALTVTATIADRHLRLRPSGPEGDGATYWEGYLQPAGLLDGPLKVTPDRGRYFWRSKHARYAALALTIEGHHGVVRHLLLRQWLAAGWG